jgi:LmbE family N-acetylglucosaminyl deacetylase
MSARGALTRLYRAIHGPLAPISQAYKELEFRKGRDATEAFARRSSLVLAPHPDDETLGCGATIMRKRRAGRDVRIVIVTDGGQSSVSKVISEGELVAIRRRETIEAVRVLGVGEESLEFWSFRELQLEEERSFLEERLRAVIASFEPEEILIPAISDRHPDHHALNTAVRSVLDSSEIASAVYEYPIWTWPRFPWIHRPPNLVSALWHFVSDPIAGLLREPSLLVRTDGLLEAKRRAIDVYRSQTTNLTGEPEWWTFPDGFVDDFLRSHEIFFPVRDIPSREPKRPLIPAVRPSREPRPVVSAPLRLAGTPEASRPPAPGASSDRASRG